MSNPDFGSPAKHVPELLLTPVSEIGSIDTQNGKQPLMYEYPWLNDLSDTHLVAKNILNAEMRAYLNDKSIIYEPGSLEFNTFMEEFRKNMRVLLPQGTETSVDIGTPVVVEGYSKTEQHRTLNIIFALAKDREGEKEFFLLAHPVESRGDMITPALQRRTDTNEFQPPIWYIQKDYPFGYRGTFPKVVSYPTKK